mgnify:CR=1 FL=1
MMQFFKSSTKETMNFLRYIGPGLLVTVGFIDPSSVMLHLIRAVLQVPDMDIHCYGWSHYQRSCSLSYSIMQHI